VDNRVKILAGFAVLLAAVVIVVAVGGGGDDEDSADSGSATELEVEVLEEGEGPEAQEGDTLQVRYTGTLLEDGTEFDSNADGRAPALPVTLGQGGVIPGFEQGLEGAKAGEKRKITIPSDLGYGAQGQPPTIPPDADLVFEIEVESIGSGGAGGAPPK
jgi:peptidylprolyl isomerase